MLNSEKAALAKASEILEEHLEKQTKRYIDVDFGPAREGDDKGHKLSIYKSGFPSVKG